MITIQIILAAVQIFVVIFALINIAFTIWCIKEIKSGELPGKHKTWLILSILWIMFVIGLNAQVRSSAYLDTAEIHNVSIYTEGPSMPKRPTMGHIYLLEATNNETILHDVDMETCVVRQHNKPTTLLINTTRYASPLYLFSIYFEDVNLELYLENEEE